MKTTAYLCFCVISLLLLSGCVGSSTYTSRTDYPDGTTLTIKAKLTTPFYPLEQSSLTVSNDWMLAVISPSQDAAGIKKVEAKSRERIFQYGMFGLLIAAGAFCLYRKKIKTGLIVIGCGLAGIAVVSFVEAAAPVMKYILPALIVVGAVFGVWWYVVRRRDFKKP